MKPSTQDIIAAVQQTLKEKVAPLVDDPWGASALRSVDAILQHLHARVPVEGPVLYEDNDDIVSLLSSLRIDLASDDASLDQEIQQFLKAAANLKETAYPNVDRLADLNIQGRELVDKLLRLCVAKQGQASYRETRVNIRAYLDRHIERETAFFFPTFVGRPV